MRKFFAPLFALCLAALIVPAAAHADDSGSQPGAVFIMTNSATANEIIAFSRSADGTLTEQGHFATSGRGSGGTVDPLGSQGSLTLSDDHGLLFAVNDGSNTVSVFRVRGAQLDLLHTVSSGGSGPVAVAQRGQFVYVANDGPNANLVAFRISSDGNLQQVGSAMFTTGTSLPSGVAINTNGTVLAVTERANNLIDTFRINIDGTLGARVSTPSAGPGPFSLVFVGNGVLTVTEATDAAISSYALQPDGSLAVITASLSTLGKAACWNVVTSNGRFTYTSNAASASLSAFSIVNDGSLTAVAGTVVAAQPAGSSNIDIAMTQNGKFLYSLNTGTGTIGGWTVQNDGSLLHLGTGASFPATSGFNGIAAF
jgi:6-phosphogluconolactonase